MEGTSRSLPLYAPLALDPTGREHLAVLDAAAALDDPAFGSAEVWQVGRSHPGTAELLAALGDRLATASVGLRLYALGSEDFLWSVMAATNAGGLGRDEVRLARTGDPARRIRCVHCHHIGVAPLGRVDGATVTCGGCGRRLTLRPHFSPRLGAYLGVAEPGGTP